ncbi:hypothetical protein [Microvirga arabica]|uniref:hypothetical protein n=1 Tax=Microvirga arabica TaxID=1128671 RepID=UPI001939FD85|nr:hypothetical protein [Microvirga arabica]MBM1170180.1 hypothetical protein [Microvirga arabica]
MWDTPNDAIRAALAFLDEVKTPTMPNGDAPVTNKDWLKWHRNMAARADGNRSRLSSNILQGNAEEVTQARALQEELWAVAQYNRAEAEKRL